MSNHNSVSHSPKRRPRGVGQIRQAIVDGPTAGNGRTTNGSSVSDSHWTATVSNAPARLPGRPSLDRGYQADGLYCGRRVGGEGRSRQGIPRSCGGFLRRQPSLRAFPMRCSEGAVLRKSDAVRRHEDDRFPSRTRWGRLVSLGSIHRSTRRRPCPSPTTTPYASWCPASSFSPSTQLVLRRVAKARRD